MTNPGNEWIKKARLQLIEKFGNKCEKCKKEFALLHRLCHLAIHKKLKDRDQDSWEKADKHNKVVPF